MIRLTGVSKRYSQAGSDMQALIDVDLEIVRGEFVVFTGPSASGKTTLLNLIGLIDVPSSGRYRFDGADLADYSDADRTELRKRHIAFIHQGLGLVTDLSLLENVELPARYRGLSRRRSRLAAREALELVGLEGRGTAYPDELSRGERQLVAVARAIVSDPALILADEPTRSLDDDGTDRVVDMLQTLNAIGTTILMVTHAQLFAARAGRVVRLADGRIVTG